MIEKEKETMDKVIQANIDLSVEMCKAWLQYRETLTNIIRSEYKNQRGLCG